MSSGPWDAHATILTTPEDGSTKAEAMCWAPTCQATVSGLQLVSAPAAFSRSTSSAGTSSMVAWYRLFQPPDPQPPIAVIPVFCRNRLES
jgi:hypothetical protein